MNLQNSQSNQGIQVIARAAAVLRVLGQNTDGLSLGQIARAVDLPRSTVQRIVGALAAEGFISTAGGSGRIRLGPEIQNLAVASNVTPLERIRPVMQQISDATGETVDLAVLRDGRMHFLDQIEGRQRLRTVSSIGESFPLANTANGKAALACLDVVEATRLLSEAPTPDRKLSSILAEIEDIRDGAMARDEDEHTDGISALGFGFTDPSGEVYAISIPTPSSRYGRIKDKLLAALKAARTELSL